MTAARVVLRGLAAAGLVAVVILSSACNGVVHVAGTGSTAPGDDDADPDEPAAETWSLLLYMNGDNDLEQNLLDDLNEVEAAPLDGVDLTVLALVDRAEGHATGNGNWTGTRLYRMTRDPDGRSGVLVSERLASPRIGLTAEGDEEELNLGGAGSLSDFLDFAAAEYPADRTALVIWGHGGGYRSGGHGNGGYQSGGVAPTAIGARAATFDDGSGGDPLLTAELGAALSGRDLDVIAFDLCYGALLEVAYEVRDSADRFIASQDVVGPDGWEYDRFLERFLSGPRSVDDFGKAAVGAFAEVYAGSSRATISEIKLSEVEAVSRALDELSLSLFDWVGADDRIARRNALRDGIFENVEDFYETPGDLNIDLWDLADHVAGLDETVDATADSLRRAVERAVVAEWHAEGNARAHGLAVHYVPLDEYGYPTVHADSYFQERQISAPLAFVADSAWVPNEIDRRGLLYRLWYEAL